MAVMPFLGFLDTPVVSNSAAINSFMLSMCIEVLESTTNSLSFASVDDGAGRHHTSEGEKNVALFSAKSRATVWQILMLLRTHRSLAKVSPWLRSSNFAA